MEYDKMKHSLNKLGYAGMVPVLPMAPVGAQMIPAMMGPRVHYLMDPTGVYINGSLPGIPPAKVKEVSAAIKGLPKEASYSGTGSEYFKLTIGVDAAHADRFLIYAGSLLLGYGLIDPAMDITSGDEDDAHQTPKTETAAPAPAPAPTADNTPAGDPTDPTAGMGTGASAATAPDALTEPDPDQDPETGEGDNDDVILD